MSKPLMPNATAVWLIENTKLTFKQIADFCLLHVIEVEALANEENFKSLKGLNPIVSGEITEDSIKRSEDNENLPLEYADNEEYNKYVKSLKKDNTKQSKFKRKNKPEAILWLVLNYKHINDYQIAKLLNTTTNTIKSIRSKSYWNYKNLSPKNPVTLNLCSEEDLYKVLHTSKEETTIKI